MHSHLANVNDIVEIYWHVVLFKVIATDCGYNCDNIGLLVLITVTNQIQIVKALLNL